MRDLPILNNLLNTNISTHDWTAWWWWSALQNKTMTFVFLVGGDECRIEVIEHDFIFLLLFPQCEPFVG